MRLSAIKILAVWGVACFWEATAQYAYTTPEPAVNDFNSVNIITQGTIAQFVWLINSMYQPTISGNTVLNDDGECSLWLTSFESEDYTLYLAANVKSGGGGLWSYKVELSDDEISDNDGKFVYCIKPVVDSITSDYPTTEDEVPSRGFLIQQAVEVGPHNPATLAAKSTAAAAPSTEAAASSAPAAATTVEAAPQSSDQVQAIVIVTGQVAS
ncbi:uncharacterized protein BDZ99DRAFT_182664 [Mytilinidion resinicola]|uniref:Uncharacterized protein n=1 Tax=Mytilinidion resinicola TaxID=574789 RepID=A0A6A6Z1J9_9PEZI|nr:uncharacterized protein BDZ99DRAFT_182664 [Mytilinidion resinicola]KAF2814678.1 hypothetical protein BDZ99DRAFT_182664 [Mytilinidion resinicola]